jgi:hypothetical protein
VRTIAIGCISRSLTHAECRLFALIYFELKGFDTGALVGAVAKGLSFRPAAAAIPVFLTGFERNEHGFGIGNFWIRHFFSPSIERNTTIGNAGEVRHVSLPGGQIVDTEAIDMLMTTGAGHDFYQVIGGTKEIVETLGAALDDQSLAQVRLLGGDTNRAIIGIAGAHAETADGLNRRIGDGNGIRPSVIPSF